MNITPYHNLPILTGFERPPRPRASSSDVQQKRPSNLPINPSQTSQIIHSSTGNVSNSQRIRTTVNAQAMFNQNLTHRGSQAKDIYQDVELSNEAELMPRLNVIA